MAERGITAPEELEADGTAAEVGRRIQARRLELGLTQAEVAAGMLSPSYLSLVESGRRQPADSALEHIASRLGVDPGFLKDGIDAQARRRARLSLGQAEIALHRGDAGEAHKLFGSLEFDPGLTDEQQRQARLGRARAAEQLGDFDEAIDILRDLTVAAHRNPSIHPWLDAATSLARCYRLVGDIDLAVQVGEQSMREASDLGLGGSSEYVQLGCVVLGAYQDRGDLAAASRLGADLVTRADAAGSAVARGTAYATAAAVAESRGQIAQALSLTDRALNLLGDLDEEREVDRLRLTQAGLLLSADPPEPVRALSLVDQVQGAIAKRAALPGAASSDLEFGRCETERARAMLAMRRLDAARDAAAGALTRLNGRASSEVVRARTVLARILLADGDVAGSLTECAAAASTLGELGQSRAAAPAWRELGGLFRDAGRPDDAMDAYEHALGAARVPAS